MSSRNNDADASVKGDKPNDRLNEGSLASQDLNSFLDIKSPSTFLFSMSSDAMRRDGILKGDIVVCRRDLVPQDGDILLAAVDGKFYVRLFSDGERPVLTCSDDRYGDIVINEVRDFELFGVVSSIIRKPKRFISK